MPLWHLLGLLAGLVVAWLFIFRPMDTHPHASTTCLLHKHTGVACPGCGLGRGIHLAAHGELAAALWMNPISLLLLALGAVVFVLAVTDLLAKKRRATHFLRKISQQLGRYKYVVVGSVVLNWAWNIWKFWP